MFQTKHLTQQCNALPAILYSCCPNLLSTADYGTSLGLTTVLYTYRCYCLWRFDDGYPTIPLVLTLLHALWPWPLGGHILVSFDGTDIWVTHASIRTTFLWTSGICRAIRVYLLLHVFLIQLNLLVMISLWILNKFKQTVSHWNLYMA